VHSYKRIEDAGMSQIPPVQPLMGFVKNTIHKKFFTVGSDGIHAMVACYKDGNAANVMRKPGFVFFGGD
jgi:hypothetical protein